ncbi:22203_t:CDS:2 [Rhizophagus irregularis]|nr:22203_t:CDS:2 [Rhizophagus irregularis]
MGVKNLTKLLQRYAPNSIKQKIIQDYRNKTLVLDGSIFLRKFVYSFSYENEEILHPHIYGFYRLLLFLKQNSINPIFIFDGKERISEKRKEIAKRRTMAEKLLRNLDFEKTRKDRVGKWKLVVKELDNIGETKHQYVTSGIKQVIGNVLSQPSPASTAEIDITSVPEVTATLPYPIKADVHSTKTDIHSIKTDMHSIKTDMPSIVRTRQDTMLWSLQKMIVLVMHEDIKSKSKDFKAVVKEKVKKIKNVTKEKVKVTTPIVNEPVMKTITDLKDEKKFKEIYPDFEPSASDVKLKEDMEQIIKMTIQDTKKLATDKNFTKAQREVGLMENLLVDSILSGNKNSETFEALEAKNHNLAAAYEKRVIPITWKMYLESINFIRTGGIPCIVLDGHEAEAMCASLVTHGFADATVSEDMDTTIFGDGILLRQFFKKNKPIVEISPVEVKKSLELSHDQYIDLCILCGTDFAGTIRNVGPVTALKLIKQYGSIENILPDLKDRYLAAPDYIVEVEAARKLYKNPPKITQDIRDQLEFNTENTDEFNHLLEKFDIDSTINEPLDYNVIVYDVNSAEDIDSKYLGPDPFSANTTVPNTAEL